MGSVCVCVCVCTLRAEGKQAKANKKANRRTNNRANTEARESTGQQLGDRDKLAGIGRRATRDEERGSPTAERGHQNTA